MARIVIVDDDGLICAIVARTLTPLGHVVLPVGDGADALDSLWDSGPDLVILDCALPGKTGLAILGEMRTSAMFRDLPVVILTARRSEWHVKMALDAGANAYVRKPFAPEELVEKVTALLAPVPVADLSPATATAPETLLDCDRLADLRGAVGDADADRLLEMMVRDIGARTEAIAGALAEGNHVRAEREAHALRGACNGIGALDLALACLAIERGECRTSDALTGLAVRTMAAIEEARATTAI
jgi:DNA-binding response OmpR family regulator